MGDSQLILGGKLEGPLLVTGNSTVSALQPVSILPSGVRTTPAAGLQGKGLLTDGCPRAWGPSPLALPRGERHQGPHGAALLMRFPKAHTSL